MNQEERIMIFAARLYDKRMAFGYRANHLHEELGNAVLNAARGGVGPCQLKETEEALSKLEQSLCDIKSILNGLKGETEIDPNARLYVRK